MNRSMRSDLRKSVRTVLSSRCGGGSEGGALLLIYHDDEFEPG